MIIYAVVGNLISKEFFKTSFLPNLKETTDNSIFFMYALVTSE